MEAFALYIRDRGIFINDGVKPHQFPGHGLGIAATGKIEKGTVLMHVPLSGLVMPSFTASSMWFAIEDKDEIVIRAHAKLATQVAFGHIQGQDAWLAIWPTLVDFQATLPLLWPEQTRELYCRSCARQSQMKGSQELNCSKFCWHSEKSLAVLPPAVTGLWATVSSAPPATSSKMKSTTREIDGKPLLPSQSAKFDLDLTAAQHLYPNLNFSQKDILDRFTWAWCIVNTRCFYYVAPGFTPPDDSDEAMVLCPGVDLFNHASHGCDVTYDSEGFWVRAERTYEPGEEIMTSYGAHGEDTLMVEYGFLLGEDSNEWDGVGIDGVVLATLKADEKKLLEEYGFLGGYTMRRDGVCWRTEVAARCLVMEVTKWDRFVSGRWTDEEDENQRQKMKKIQRHGTVDADGYQTPKQMASRQMMRWVEQVKKEAENSLSGLEALDEDEVWRLFGSNEVSVSKNIGLDQKIMADARQELVMRRWRQIVDICSSALKSLAHDG